MSRETFGDYKPAFGLNGFIVTVDECNFVTKNETAEDDNGNKTEELRYLQEERLFLLRDYDILSEEVEVNIVLSPLTTQLLGLTVVTKGEYVSMKMNLNRWKSYIDGGLNKGGFQIDSGYLSLSAN